MRINSSPLAQDIEYKRDEYSRCEEWMYVVKQGRISIRDLLGLESRALYLRRRKGECLTYSIYCVIYCT